MSFGLTLDGFKKKRLADIKSEIESDLRDSLGENISLIPQSVLGQIVGIVSEREALEWEAMEQIYFSFYPLMASGRNLDDLVAINGISRLEATKSYGYVQLYGTDETVVPAGTILSETSYGNKFEIEYDTVINGVTNANVLSVEYGPVVATAGTLTKIETPVAGLDSVSNSTDITLGTNEETDEELRVRREKIILRNSQNLADSLKSQISLIDSVRNVTVIDNKTAETDSNGVPAHSFMAIVDGGDDTEIGKAVWDNTPQGITSFGSVVVQVEDASKTLQNVYFSRPTAVDIYMIITITTDSTYMAGSEVQIEEDVASFGNDTFNLGDDVIVSRFYTPVNKTQGIVGIDIKVGKSPSPTASDNIPIGNTEVAVFDTANISVVVQ